MARLLHFALTTARAGPFRRKCSRTAQGGSIATARQPMAAETLDEVDAVVRFEVEARPDAPYERWPGGRRGPMRRDTRWCWGNRLPNCSFTRRRGERRGVPP